MPPQLQFPLRRRATTAVALPQAVHIDAAGVMAPNLGFLAAAGLRAQLQGIRCARHAREGPQLPALVERGVDALKVGVGHGVKPTRQFHEGVTGRFGADAVVYR